MIVIPCIISVLMVRNYDYNETTPNDHTYLASYLASHSSDFLFIGLL